MVDMKKIFDFLNSLEENNNREWFHEHKKERLEATREFEDLIQELILVIGNFDESVLKNHPKDLTFKLVRDTRFSHDKSPYNPTFRAHISSRGKLPIPVGYFICIQPHHTIMLGGGLFSDMFKDATTMMRDYIVENGKDFERVLTNQEFVKNYQILGSCLKKVPKGYDNTHPQSQYLKYKSWFVETYIRDEKCLYSDDFIEKVSYYFKTMKPFNDYLNQALTHFKMPLR